MAWKPWVLTTLSAIFVAWPIPTAQGDEPASLVVSPSEFMIVGRDDVQRLRVSAPIAGRERMTADLGREARYESSDPAVATVGDDGVVVPRGDGLAEIRVAAGGRTAVAKVTVRAFGTESRVSFRNQVIPAFTRYGCNAGGCHGKATGQNGFKLSLLGFDADYDFNEVVRAARGRRVFPAAPERSLVLLKAVGAVPHGGGQRFATDSMAYGLIRRWIEQGTPPGSAADPRVVRVECAPKVGLVDRHARNQIVVTAHYSDGRSRDVTREAQFKSSDPHVAQVDDEGLVTTGDGSGETAVMARFMGLVDVCRITVPLAEADGPWPALPPGNEVDRLVRAKWAKLNLVPSPLADDATFLRRAFVDGIGTLPTPDEVREFLADPNPEKRAAWVDRILGRPEYADFWAVQWGDLLRNQRKRADDARRGTYAFHAWIRNAFAANMPYDQFVRGIVAAQGTVDQHPPVSWYRTVRNLTHQTNDTAQLFLGTRINCAQCHHHPYEKWSQDDYYRLQAFFARMGRKSGDTSSDTAIYVKPDGQVRNPATGQVMPPRGLDGPEVTIGEDEDPRQKLVDWMVDPANPMFAPAIANRLWAHFTGRGLVEPVDDMRVTNPPSNPELLDYLARDLVAHRFDLKHLIRTIMVSTTYQLASDPTAQNIDDRQNYARSYPRRIIAEVILDAVSQVTGTRESFGGLPEGIRAIELPDESVNSYFLDVFGRPARETACECERPREANLAQTLHLLNSAELQTKIGSGSGRISTLLEDKKSDDAIVEELYLAALGRPPRPDERSSVLTYVERHAEKRAAWEDLAWALLNSKEFLFNH